MEVVTSVQVLEEKIDFFRKKKKEIGFTPTMGALHQGHLSLIKKSIQENQINIVSIFVNPTQFTAQEDFKTYPRNLGNDIELLEPLPVDICFAPSVEAIYPGRWNSEKFPLPELFSWFEGQIRPHFFHGVAEILKILFSYTRPQNVYFGQKDYQQTLLVAWLIEYLKLDIKLHVCPTIREENGLALSSRNNYLHQTEKKAAAGIFNALKYLQKIFAQGEKNIQKLESIFKETLLKTSLIQEIEYASIRDKKNLSPLSILKPDQGVALLAVKIGKTRLLDNILL